jgi:hypothetical protein
MVSDWGTVGGGLSNKAGEPTALSAAAGETVVGGEGNTASGPASTVAGGEANTASAYYSFAAGCQANAVNIGDFVWSGSTGGGSCTTLSTTGGPGGQFVALAPGGVIFYSNTGLTSGVALAACSETWSSLSDRNMKDHFEPVNGRTLLARLNVIPMASWNYKAQPASIRHLGPMAQDFYAAFGLGEDDKHITTVDERSVALAGVQALHRLSLDKDTETLQLQTRFRKLAAEVGQLRQMEASTLAENQRLTAEVQRLKAVEARMAALEARLAQLEVKNARPPADSPAREAERTNPAGAARLEAKVRY